MAQSRTRTRESDPIIGYGTWIGSPISHWATARRETTHDVVKNFGGVNTFESIKTERSGNLLYGNDGNLVANGLPVQCNIPGMISDMPAINQENYGNRILAQSGPLTPRIFLPVSLFELRDIPKMLRHAGNLLHKIGGRSGLDPVKEAAAANLAYQFGWAPLIEDIGKMLDFSDIVRKRQRILLGAHSERGIRRRVILDSNSRTDTGSQTTWSTYTVMADQRWNWNGSYKRWATVTWKVKDKSQIGRIPTFQEGMRTALGLNKGHIPIAMWKAMPWTWAIDWFADISNVMLANYNMIYYQPSRCCIMTHLKGENVYSPWSSQNGLFHITMGRHTMDIKRRVPFYPSAQVTLKLPFMDSFKLSIVGSMSILALSRR